jgi:hypothetical protein
MSRISDSEKKIDQMRSATLNEFFYLPNSQVNYGYVTSNNQSPLPKPTNARTARNLFKLKAHLKCMFLDVLSNV